jgi:hypothetical protein
MTVERVQAAAAGLPRPASDRRYFLPKAVPAILEAGGRPTFPSGLELGEISARAL